MACTRTIFLIACCIEMSGSFEVQLLVSFTVELGYKVTKVPVVLTEEYNVTANSEKLSPYSI
jgi:hypothetical protein